MIENKESEQAIYRIKIGTKLKQKRLDNCLAIRDIIDMTGISKSTVLKIEKGEAKNIDNYVEYAKAVKYPLETLEDLNIKLVPLKELSDERKDATRLTSKIRKYILNTLFLTDGKSISDIRTELIRINQIEENVKSVNIAGVMRNLADDDIIKKEKLGQKNLYFKS